MTNEKAISYLSQMYIMQFNEKEHESLTIAINSIQENTKLKAEIDRLNTQIAESNQEGVSILHDILELREENEKLKKEIENLLVDKECWTCKHEELSPLSEPCYSCDDCVNWERKERV